MANLPEQAQWEEGIYQLETSDPVLAGPDGIDNLQAKQLGNRTAYLKGQVDDIKQSLASADPLDQYLLREDVAAQAGPLAWLGTPTGTVNALTFTLPLESKVDAYASGQRFQFKVTAANTGAVTVKIGALAAKSIRKGGYAGLVELDAGDLKPGVVYDLTFDGQQFQLGSGVNASSSLPVGSILPFPKAAVPAGYLELDGSVKDGAMYPDLFAYLGTTYNTGGEAAGFFRLPDSRGEFLRGWDHGRGVDAGRSLGSVQQDALQNIVGSFTIRATDQVAPDIGGLTGAFKYGADGVSGGIKVISSTTKQLSTISFDASQVARTATETRPRNLAVMWCIKAWSAPINQANIDVAALAAMIERNRVKRIARVTSAVVQALTGAALGPVAFSPLTTPFQADGGVYRITARLQMNMSSAGVAGSNYISATLMDGATVLDRVSFNIVESTWTGFSAALEWSGPLNGSVNLSVAFEKSFAAASVNVNGDRDNTTSNDSGQLSYLEILRLGDA
ncbi:tail fiber protein [Pseudomonas sichuanensis]|uniref:phage tail protein n=1 Tax=Pseudomonas sichuanensis TaxID=2213015 RepID=UPI0021604951|nr:phage tail protein [Pseudomonas sichuanensis]UVK85244.1 tail fiber protein [Pseudomonas sichuanensis]